MYTDVESERSIAELEAAFEREVMTDRRVAAETAYALAWRHRCEYVGRGHPFENARAWAGRAIELLDSLPSDSVDQVASGRAWVGGVAIPDLLHSGVVRERLCDVLRTLEV
jgi:hypothetical protein